MVGPYCTIAKTTREYLTENQSASRFNKNLAYIATSTQKCRAKYTYLHVKHSVTWHVFWSAKAQCHGEYLDVTGHTICVHKTEFL